MNFSGKLLSVVAIAAVFDMSAQDSPDYYEVNTAPSRYSSADYRPGEVIVKLNQTPSGAPARLRARSGKVTATSPDLQTLLGQLGATEVEELMSSTGSNVNPSKMKALNGATVTDTDLSTLYLIKFDNSSASSVYEIVEQLQSCDEVAYAEPNYLAYICAEPSTYTSDPLYGQQWGVPAVGVDKLWSAPSVRDKRMVIAILDTGVDITHPDLAANIWTNPHESDGVAYRDDDGNGYIDDVHGWNCVNNSPAIYDGNGHGTHCAGIAAAVGGNGIGITGANPDALIMPVMVMGSDGTGDVATIIKGLDYATANGADVISMSFGSPSNSIALSEAIVKAYSSAVLVAAAGNNGRSIYYRGADSGLIFPGAYYVVLGVQASCDAEGHLAFFSNFDPDGPVASKDEENWNYELTAPGVNIMSTFPGGQYKALNGTSMATPLAAGAISRLLSTKEKVYKEELYADIITSAKGGNLDVYSAYNVKDSDRVPTLTLVTYRLDDAKMGDGDGRPDAGETVRVYPTFRNFWGTARNITYSIRLADYEDPDIVEFLEPEASHFISNLSSYASAEAETPFLIKINPLCPDGRKIDFVLTATCDNITEPLVQTITFEVENGVELCGLITEDMTLTPDKNYIVTSNLAVMQNVTLTILPGTTLKIREGANISVDNGEFVWSDNKNPDYPNAGKIIALGKPGKMIKFIGENSLKISMSVESKFSYCIFENFVNGGILDQASSYSGICNGFIENCLIKDNGNFYFAIILIAVDKLHCFNVFKNLSTINLRNASFSNFVYVSNTELRNPTTIDLQSNIFNNSIGRYSNDYSFAYALNCDKPTTFTSDKPSYYGTGRTDFARKRIMDINQGYGMGSVDLSNMRTRPYAEAHGIVWKVVVNGYDAQDEYDWLAPLGVGRHKFEVYFNRKMNHDKTPEITMGVREPYTQIAIAEDGSWRTETFDGDEVDIYTAYLTTSGKDNFDGVNTIRVDGAEDDEYFPIPPEDVRFHVNVQSAGSMSAGFEAEAGVGKVKLTWENPEENFDDMLGYNMYRYTLDANEVAGDTVRINETLLTEEEYIDYDIVPGTTYCYYYKVLRTSLDENAPSKVVAATPRAAGKGDADASGAVDVADVITEINFMTGNAPKPFIFDAADVNDDGAVDILDVVGTVNIIMGTSNNATASALSTAVYTVENGRLYIDSDAEIAGLQIELSVDPGIEIRPGEALAGMECIGQRVADDRYRFLAFSLGGKALGTGKNDILELGDAEIDNLILVDSNGRRIIGIRGGMSGIGENVLQQMRLPYPNPFVDELHVPVAIGDGGDHDVTLTLSSISGIAVAKVNRRLESGEHEITIDGSRLREGFYLLTLTVDDQKVQTVKVIKQ